MQVLANFESEFDDSLRCEYGYPACQTSDIALGAGDLVCSLLGRQTRITSINENLLTLFCCFLNRVLDCRRSTSRESLEFRLYPINKEVGAFPRRSWQLLHSAAVSLSP